MSSGPIRCQNCGTEETELQQCAGCKGVLYCGAECQGKDWKENNHKKLCKALKKAAKNGFFKEITTEAPEDAPLATQGKEVVVHYTGTLTNGDKFDSSRDKGRPFRFPLGAGRVISAWDEGVATMRIGERALLYASPDYAYGPGGHPPVIPPNSFLIFDVEVLEQEA
ncbi:FK506-binding protein [Thecamonas trahens ATCC 50062]|uniref:peptidylprolyl isomerase n=1 Tax=Thecamonas trahens ATCC 50062 TaxID=461836 RepID=A0A0L0D228_THETB|nr:FK506-binding protein [Thecamonas trahens ATCC 50062]KNC46332.1 FK506-binding protein [Thecamonas trahens ATCC 50062]|eukprot:XP_013760625.1 FK506-binding protein [Thecamonas trahens ATCC 50062]